MNPYLLASIMAQESYNKVEENIAGYPSKSINLTGGRFYNHVDAPFKFEELVGLRVTDYMPGRCRLVTPKRKPPEDIDGRLIQINLMNISYTSNGVLDKPILAIVPDNHIELFELYPKYDMLAYVYETTHDTMGLGVTLEPGWYYLNTSNYLYEPVTLGKYDVLAQIDYLKEGMLYEYVLELFEPAEVISFIINEENIVKKEDDYYTIWRQSASGIRKETYAFCEGAHASFSYNLSNNKIGNIYTNDYVVTITYPSVKQLDRELIPPTPIQIPVSDLGIYTLNDILSGSADENGVIKFEKQVSGEGAIEFINLIEKHQHEVLDFVAKEVVIGAFETHTVGGLTITHGYSTGSKRVAQISGVVSIYYHEKLYRSNLCLMPISEDGVFRCILVKILTEVLQFE